MSKSQNPVWVIVEQAEKGAATVGLELLGKARKLADELACPLEAILLGKDAQDLTTPLFAAGAD